MDIALLHISQAAQLLLTLATLIVVLIRTREPSLRHDQLVAIVATACDFGSASPDKMGATLDAARRLDVGDNGKRDFSDAEFRIAIEAEYRRRAA